MLAVIINTIAIIIGTGVGLLFRKGIPKNISEAVMKALGLCTIVIGVQGSIREPDILLMIVSVVLGLLLGESIDLDGKINHFTECLTARFAVQGESAGIANAFITSCLIMNVGAMVIVGSLNAGLRADFSLLYTKSLLDFICSIMMGAVMGIGVIGSAGFTLLFQGAIVLTAQYLAPFLSDALIIEVSCTGSLLILAIGLNMIKLTNFKVINYLPALLVLPIIFLLKNFLG
ncbi:DUF554 domain-containing protein [Pectinatus brassicae]|uniref:DUF554 domain-containing protein n=1 Tax=Pectinatus brassicae TaxID=862415 RepID=A0A840UMR4_9FIRM|nr:DUF554 domain-containing protein [Pectinatus brassicae]MBB5337107.1 hypothetical protein [Pectinatus brassicae]